MNDNARKAGDYEIIHAVHVGEKEVVVGELPYDSPQKYMCAMYEENDIAGQYFNCMVGDSYPEAMILFAERVKSQAEKAQERLENLNVPSEDKKEFDYNKAKPVDYKDSITDKVIVIKSDVLRREYRSAVDQLYLCTGGFGSYPEARGRTCYCTNLYTGNTTRFYRDDVYGIADENKLPKWAVNNLENIRNEQQAKNRRKDRDSR